jgi:hypothetical protein
MIVMVEGDGGVRTVEVGRHHRLDSIDLSTLQLTTSLSVVSYRPTEDHEAVVDDGEPQAQKSFWAHPMVLLGDEVKCKPDSVCLEIVVILIQDRDTVCVERTIGSKIILTTPDRTLGHVRQVESHFGLFRDSVSISAR